MPLHSTSGVRMSSSTSRSVGALPSIVRLRGGGLAGVSPSLRRGRVCHSPAVGAPTRPESRCLNH
eukprot:9447076-Alexandrium_andersonii.AAC.1